MPGCCRLSCATSALVQVRAVMRNELIACMWRHPGSQHTAVHVPRTQVLRVHAGCRCGQGRREKPGRVCEAHLPQRQVHRAQAVVGLQQQQQLLGDLPEQVGDLLCKLRCVALRRREPALTAGRHHRCGAAQTSLPWQLLAAAVRLAPAGGSATPCMQAGSLPVGASQIGHNRPIVHL